MNRYVCTGCSLLCDDIIVTTDGIYIDQVIGACLKGKERFDLVNSENRILGPLIRKNDLLEKVSWDSALEKTIDTIRYIINGTDMFYAL